MGRGEVVGVDTELVAPPRDATSDSESSRIPLLLSRYQVTLINNPNNYKAQFVERNGSAVELRTFDYENPGSNPVLRCLGQVFSLYIAPVHSAV